MAITAQGWIQLERYMNPEHQPLVRYSRKTYAMALRRIESDLRALEAAAKAYGVQDSLAAAIHAVRAASAAA